MEVGTVDRFVEDESCEAAPLCMRAPRVDFGHCCSDARLAFTLPKSKLFAHATAHADGFCSGPGDAAVLDSRSHGPQWCRMKQVPSHASKSRGLRVPRFAACPAEPAAERTIALGGVLVRAFDHRSLVFPKFTSAYPKPLMLTSQQSMHPLPPSLINLCRERLLNNNSQTVYARTY